MVVVARLRGWRSHADELRLTTDDLRLFGVSALLFAASAALTTLWCASMSAMGGMPMPGGWTMSMAWMRMPGQTWPGAAVSFLGMWVVMMVAMMLPSLAPMLWRYRRAVGRAAASAPTSPFELRRGRLTALAGAGYFFVWTVFGMAAFPVGVALAAVEMQQPVLARTVPIAAGVVVLIAGVLQFTAWKARHLAACREASACARGGVSASHGETSPKRPPAAKPGAGRGRTLSAEVGAAWRHGLRLGLHCIYCCTGLMAILLVLGVMDLRAMAVVTAAITAERLAPAGERVARAIGAVIVGAGLFLIARAAGLG
jgi:predicted metal-binding membrane protein